jgi:hypothetical protein
LLWELWALTATGSGLPYQVALVLRLYEGSIKALLRLSEGALNLRILRTTRCGKQA